MSFEPAQQDPVTGRSRTVMPSAPRPEIQPSYYPSKPEKGDFQTQPSHQQTKTEKGDPQPQRTSALAFQSPADREASLDRRPPASNGEHKERSTHTDRRLSEHLPNQHRYTSS